MISWKPYFTLILLSFLALQTRAQIQYDKKIQLYRDSINAIFKDSNTTILEEKYRKDFKELEYFTINEAYKVSARFEPIKKGKTFEMKTTTSRRPLYKPYGKLHFELNGKSYSLTLYQNLDLSKKKGYEDYLFLPFTDATNGDETYGGGRYLDLKIADLKAPVLDFNLCYNPYCTYNTNYSCPIPPIENHLDVRIEAGVKNFEK